MKRSIMMLMAIVFLSTIILAQPRQGRRDQERPKGHKERFEKMAEALELTDDQRKQVEDIRFQSMKSTKVLKNDLGEKEAKLRTLTTADNPDGKAVKSLAKQIGDIRGDLFVMKVESRLQIRAVLDEKQKLKFDMMGEHHRRKGRNF